MRSIAKSRFVIIGAALIALMGARPYASSWNDGSRLASVESLVDRHSWVIDDSIFVKVLPRNESNPYSLTISSSPVDTGTQDKIFIHGHFYSDKPPVATLYLAGVYWVAQKLTGLTAAQNSHAFVYLMTVASSGLPYVLGVLCVWLLALTLGLSEINSLLITASFALATIAPVYARQVNNHILQLAPVALIFLLATSAKRRAIEIGLLAGMAYTLDLGIGPVLVLSALVFAAMKWRSISSTILCALAMFPFMALHHWLNYSIGGSVGPMNANPEYFEYPGSHFSAGHISGHWAHHNIGDFILYSLGLWVGPHGFLLYNLPLLLIPIVAVGVWRAFPARRSEIFFAALFTLGSWCVYAVGSTNYAGLCCSIRWFVPLLIPGYFVLILALSEKPALLGQFKLLSGFGFVLTIVLFWIGPFENIKPILFWPIVGLAILALYGVRRQASSALDRSAASL